MSDITDDVIVAGSKADDKICRRMKLAYSDSSIDGRQSVLTWSELLGKKMQKQDITLVELRQAVQQGGHVSCDVM